MTRADYAPSTQTGTGGAVAAVDKSSPAERAGVHAGDVIVAVDGHPVSDILDWQWLTEGDEIALELADRSVNVTRDPDETWGVSFSSALFDSVRTCNNRCAFCFMEQLPRGMRKALYVRDDDFRLSFLQGNFVTLTNLDALDVARILEQHLSPLYVSIHAIDATVREQLVCVRGEDRALENFDSLLDGGIDVHVQVVLVPGVNDGPVLDETLSWLAEREGVLSVGIVPLGYTKYQDRFARSYENQIDAATVIQQVQRWQFAMKERDNVSWVHLADEFYLNARAPIPSAEWYDDFPQYENGIGIVRTFVDEATGLREQMIAAVKLLPDTHESVTCVVGMMGATTIAGALHAFDAVGRVRVLVVPNRFFGGNVSVTGLLTGRDIADAVKADAGRPDALPTTYLLPDIVLNADGLTLDDMTLAQLVAESGAEVRLVSSDAAGLLAGLQSAAAEARGR